MTAPSNAAASIAALFALLSFGLCSAASAADAGPAGSWSGFYAGVEAGGDWSGVSGPFGNAVRTGFGPYAITAPGALLGGYAGYNWQWRSLVLGAEGDANGVFGSQTTDRSVPFAGGLAFYDIGAKQSWTADARLRAGYTVGRALLFVAGGAAFADVRTTYARAGAPPALAVSSDRAGWTIGGGVEYAFTDRLVGRVEYRHADFGRRAFTNVPLQVYDNVRFTSDQALVGVSYKIW